MSYKTHRYIKNTFGIVPEIRLGKRMTYLVEDGKITITSWSGVPTTVRLNEGTIVEPLTDEGFISTAFGALGFGDVLIKTSAGERKIEGLKNIERFIEAVNLEIGIESGSGKKNAETEPVSASITGRGTGKTFKGTGDPNVLERYETFQETFRDVPESGKGLLTDDEELLFTCTFQSKSAGKHRIFVTSDRILVFNGFDKTKDAVLYEVISLPHFSIALIERIGNLFVLRRIDGPLPERHPYTSFKSALEDAKRYRDELGIPLSNTNFPEPTNEEEALRYHALSQISGNAGKYDIGSNSTELINVLDKLRANGAFPNESVIKI